MYRGANSYLEAYLDISFHLNRLCSDAWTTDTPSLVYEPKFGVKTPHCYSYLFKSKPFVLLT